MITPIIFPLQLPPAARAAQPLPPQPFNRVWYWKAVLPHRKGQPCRITARGKMNSALVEFLDGEKVITQRYAVRKLLDQPSNNHQISERSAC